MSRPNGTRPSSLTLPSHLRQYCREIMAARMSDPAGGIGRQTRCQERRYTCGRLVRAEDVSEADPWHGLLNNGGGGAS